LHGARPDDDLIAMIDEFGPRVHFTHLRSTHREADPLPFYEASHFDGDLDSVAIVWELPKRRRSVPFRRLDAAIVSRSAR
jgi:mannonate dehydratase